MSKIIPAILIISLMALMSCNKNLGTINGGSGNWTFKNVNYIPGSFNNSSSRITAIYGNSSSMLSIFFNTPLPTSNGVYTVANTQGAGGSNAVSISLTVNGPTAPTTYWMTGGNGAEIVTVQVSGNNIALVGSGIEMLNATAPSLNDSASLSFDILTTN